MEAGTVEAGTVVAKTDMEGGAVVEMHVGVVEEATVTGLIRWDLVKQGPVAGMIRLDSERKRAGSVLGPMTLLQPKVGLHDSELC